MKDDHMRNAQLKLGYNVQIGVDSEYISEVTVYECADCSGCPHKDKCTKAKGNKQLYVSKNFIDHQQTSYENIISEMGIKYHMNHSIQVEGAFGVLKNDYDFQRFLL